jgi:hypothetical protein
MWIPKGTKKEKYEKTQLVHAGHDSLNGCFPIADSGPDETNI